MKKFNLTDTYFFELRFIFQRLYPKFLEPVCAKYEISRVELDVVLFFANNPQYDTATEIVELRNLTKSHVSAAVSKLEERGFIERFYKDGNHRTVHISLTDAVMPIVKDGRKAQRKFGKVLNEGITEEENAVVSRVFRKIVDNAHKAQEKN